MLPPPAELAKLPDDLIGEFFLRLPTDDPACLLRASLACKRWRRILTDQAFRRTHRALHRRPSLLGFFHVVSKDVPYLTRFVPNDPAPCRPAGRDFQGWLLLDCRHGLALFATPIPSRVTRVTHDLIVWDPLTDVQHRLPRCSPMPAVYGGTDLMYNAAVLCAAPAEGCDHSGCHRGPFSVVVLFGENNYTGPQRPCGRHTVLPRAQEAHPKISIRHALPVSHQSASVFSVPRSNHLPHFNGGQWIGIRGCGRRNKTKCARVSVLCLWEEGPNGLGQWGLVRAIELQMLLPDGALPKSCFVSTGYSDVTPNAQVLCCVDGIDIFFMGIRTSSSDPGAVYMVQLDSGRVRKVLEGCTWVFPYSSFCIPVIEENSACKGPRIGSSSLDKLKLLMQWLLKRMNLRPHSGKVQTVEQ